MGETDSPASKAFATQLAKYAYTPSNPSRRKGSVPGQQAGSSSHDTTAPVTPSPRPSRTASAKKRIRDKDPLSSSSSDGYSEHNDEDDSPRAGPSNRKAITPRRKPSRQEEGSPSVKKAKKVPRPYAGPEVYAHLSNTPDHLAVNLDIIFCGINPGKKSAATGTHFAHPTNKFWRALHQSGLTPRLYAPNECHLLPSDLNYGLTNLCGRPTAEQSELSTLEMRLNVHPFTLKLLRLRPRIVCFVGKKIWDVYEAVSKKTATVSIGDGGHGAMSSLEIDNIGDLGGLERSRAIREDRNHVDLGGYEDEVPLKVEEGDGMSEPVVKTEPGLSINGGDAATDMPSDNQTSIEVEIKPDLPSFLPAIPIRQNPRVSLSTSTPQRRSSSGTMDWYKPRSIRLPLPPLDNGTPGSYCYFWVTPSTSGLERTPMAEQANIFSALRQFSEELRHRGDPPPERFRDVDIGGLGVTSDKIKAEAIAKGKTVYPSVHA